MGYTVKGRRIVNVYKTAGKRRRHYSNGRMIPKGKRVFRSKTLAKASVKRRPKNGRRKRKRRTYKTARKWSTKGEGLSPTERQGSDVRAGRKQMSCSIHQPPCPKGCERGGGNTCRASKGRGGLGVLPKSGGGHLAGWGRRAVSRRGSARSYFGFGSPWNYGF